ncbi:MAG TPA: hypothetical protein VKF81_07945 [Blastocatellia bacterium]|nr:hypothetical protein [Blastocatellia bacterium]
MSSERTAEQVVMACLEAINREDFQTARRYVSDDISFVGIWVRGKAQMRTSKTWSGFVSNTR